MNITLERALKLKTECQSLEADVKLFDKHLNPHLAQAKDRLENIPDILLKYSGERFIYMVWCIPAWQEYLYSWIQFYHELFDQESLVNILLKLNRISRAKIAYPLEGMETIAENLLKRITADYTLKHRNILKLLEGKLHEEEVVKQGCNCSFI